MSAYYIRNEDETVQGPHAADEVQGWIAEGRLDEQTQYSKDAVTWRYARDIPALGGSGVAVTPPGAFPEPSVLIRQGASIQGPYRMSRIRGYVKQRRIQHYMLFSEDGIFWIGPEHVPGLLPDGYIPLPPPERPTAVPAGGTSAVMPKEAKPPAPGEDIGSTTLVGFSLDDEETRSGIPAPPSLPPPPPPPARSSPPSAAPLTEQVINAAPVPVTYFVRTNGHDVFGPCTEGVLKTWIEEGRVNKAAEFSNDGRTWTPGANMVSLFPGPGPQRIPGGVEQLNPIGPPPKRRFPRRR